MSDNIIICDVYDSILPLVILKLNLLNYEPNLLEIEFIKSYTFKKIKNGYTDDNIIANEIYNKLKKNKIDSPIADISLYINANPKYKSTKVIMSSLFRNPNMYKSPSNFCLSFVRSKGTKENTGFISNYEELKNIISIELLDASVPNFKVNYPTLQRLFIKFDEFDGEYYLSQMSQMFAEMLFKSPEPNSPYLVLDTQYKRIQKFRNNKELISLSKLTISIYNEYGELYQISGNDPISIVSFTNTPITTVTTAIPHGLNVGDRIFIKGFSNAYITNPLSGLVDINQGIALNNLINQYSGWAVSNVTALTFDINGLDLSSQTVFVQSDTETGAPPGSPSGYLLGSKSFLFQEKYQSTFLFELISLDK